jgi:hypothetical protein
VAAAARAVKPAAPVPAPLPPAQTLEQDIDDPEYDDGDNFSMSFSPEAESTAIGNAPQPKRNDW